MSRSSKRAFRESQAREATARALDKRDDARVDTILRIGPRAVSYAGHTGNVVDGVPAFSGRVAQTRMSAREGGTRREGKKNTLKFVPRRYDADAPKKGGAHLTAGDWLVDAAGAPVERGAGAAYVATSARIEPAAVRETITPAARDALRGAREPATVTRGNGKASERDTDPGDDPETIATARYYRARRLERGDYRPEDFDDNGNLIP